ncbi:MAG: M20/M25/M40 family metallo-hydrolase [Chloroflexia bacterium]
MERFREYARMHLKEAVEELSALCALPSVAGRPAALRETAQQVARMLEASGLEAHLFETDDGAPIVWGERLVPGRPTVLFYDHYDVQPPGDEAAWRFPPFAPRFYRNRLYGRGVVDNKGNLVARLWALRAWNALAGGPPVGVRFLVEGEEESGSPHLGAFVEAHADRLRADGCIWEAGDISSRGRAHLYLGMKGVLSVELEARGAAADLHSGWATIAPNPAWRLVWALSRIKSPDEEILIEGFYDRVEGPTHEEIRQARRIPFPEEEVLRNWQVPQFLQGLTGGNLLLCQFYSPTATINGFEAGRIDEGVRTVVPAVARARLDFRLVPKQEPEEILDLLRKHLEREGYGDIQVRQLGMAFRPFRTDPRAPFVRAVVEATRAAFGCGPALFATSGGSGPMAQVGGTLGLPIVSLGIGHAGANIHGANENLLLRNLERGIVHVAAILERLAEGLPA